MAKIGDRVKVGEHVGVLMPSVEEGVIVLKLDSGYNIGIKEGGKVEVVEEFKAKPVKKEKIKEDPKLPTVTILHTGGTIASKVDYATGGVVSRFTPEELPENKYYIFGKEGCKRLAEEMQIALLGQIPIVQGICESGDQGVPGILDENGITGKAFMDLSIAVDAAVKNRNKTKEPTKKVEIKT